MPRGAGARRHAQAVFQIALERNELEKWRQDLEAIVAVFQYPELEVLLENPKVPVPEKQGLLARLLPEVAPLALNLASLLIVRGRIGLAGPIAQEYQKMLNAYRGIAQAEVTTAIPLTEAEKETVARGLSELTGRRVQLSAQVDASIIGGFVARVEDRLIDASLRSQLQALKKSLAGAG